MKKNDTFARVMVKYIKCIVLFALLVVGKYYIQEIVSEDFQETLSTGETVSLYGNNDSYETTVIDNTDRQNLPDSLGLSCTPCINDVFLLQSNSQEGSVVSKTIRTISLSRMVSSSDFRLSRWIFRQDYDSIKPTQRYYIYALRHILI